jgi:hypothetical protein
MDVKANSHLLNISPSDCGVMEFQYDEYVDIFDCSKHPNKVLRVFIPYLSI